jgi:hypothetical protein
MIIIFLYSCTPNKSKLEKLICGDSLRYWDFISNGKTNNSPISTDCFRSDNTFISYEIDKFGNRRIMTFSDGKVAIEKWSVSEDSILTYNIGHIKISKYNDDTIFLGTTDKSNMLIRVKRKINLINLGDPGDTIKRFKQLGLPD